MLLRLVILSLFVAADNANAGLVDSLLSTISKTVSGLVSDNSIEEDVAAVVKIAIPYITVCQPGDLACTRATLAAGLGYRAVVGNGSDTFYETTPIRVDFPSCNATLRIYEAQYEGFLNAQIQSFIQQNGFSILTVFFPTLGIPVYKFSVSFYGENAIPQTLYSSGYFQLPEVTATVILRGTTPPLDLSTAQVFTTFRGNSLAGLTDLIAQIQNSGNELFINTLATLQANVDTAFLEALHALGPRAALAYATTNLAYPAVPEPTLDLLAQP